MPPNVVSWNDGYTAFGASLLAPNFLDARGVDHIIDFGDLTGPVNYLFIHFYGDFYEGTGALWPDISFDVSGLTPLYDASGDLIWVNGSGRAVAFDNVDNYAYFQDESYQTDRNDFSNSDALIVIEYGSGPADQSNLFRNGEFFLLDRGGNGGNLTKLREFYLPSWRTFSSAVVPCFTEGAMIQMAGGGVKPVQDLALGERVVTKDSGYQPIEWLGELTLSAEALLEDPGLRPIRFMPGALGNDKEFLVSPNHKMLVTGADIELMFGVEEALVEAKHLVNGRDIVVDTRLESVTYYHLMLQQPEIVNADGLWSESFVPGEFAQHMAEHLKLGGTEAFDGADGPAPRAVLKKHEAALL